MSGRVWRVERAEAVDRDLEAIFDFLFEAALGFGEGPAEAFERAAARIEAIEAAMLALGRAPHQGTLAGVLPGVRHATRDRAVFYFDLDEAARRVRVLAVFWGGQDHQRAMLIRALKAGASGG